MMNSDMAKNLQQFAQNGKGQKHVEKMMKQGCKFFKKFMKQKGNKCPFFCKKMNKPSETEPELSYEEQIQKAMKLSLEDLDKTNETEDKTKVTEVEMTVEKKTEETPKPKTEEKVTVTEGFETPKPDSDVVIIEDGKPIEELSFEEQLELAMKQSL